MTELQKKPQSTTVRTVDFETALEETGFGKFQFILIAVGGFTLYVINAEGLSISYVLPVAECELQLTTYTKGLLSSANFAGIVTTCCFWGYFSDTKGRRKVLVISLLCAFLCSGLSVFSTSLWMLIVLRFLTGAFISGPSAVVFVYFAEFYSQRYKSRAMALASLFVALCLTVLPALAWLLLPIQITGFFKSWRIYILLNAIPGLIVAIAFYLLPESGKFLYHKGDTQGALKVLEKIHAGPHPFALKLEEPKLEGDAKKSAVMGQIAALFLRPNLKYMVAACFIQGVIYAVSTGILLWYPTILDQLAKASNGGGTVCQALDNFREGDNRNVTEGLLTCSLDHRSEMDDSIFIQNIILGVAYLIGYLLWGSIVNLVGNRNFFALCMAVSSLALFLLIFATKKLLIDCLFVIFLVIPGICVALMNIALADVIPTNLRGMALCISTTAGRSGGALSGSFMGVMLETNCGATLLFYAACLLICLFLIFIFSSVSSANSDCKEKPVDV